MEALTINLTIVHRNIINQVFSSAEKLPCFMTLTIVSVNFVHSPYCLIK
jgi:hypothetical protein